jgi:hypothetical protein
MPLSPSKNFLSPHGFRFVLQRAPNIEFFCQEANIPDISIEDITQPTPMQGIWRPGTKTVFSPIAITFTVDEEMENYKEIFHWITGLAPTKNSSVYDTLNKTEEGIVSDATLLILTSNHNEGLSVDFENIFPTTLSELQFRSTDADITYTTATATFRYTRFSFI